MGDSVIELLNTDNGPVQQREPNTLLFLIRKLTAIDTMAPGDKLPDFLTNTSLDPSFDKDIRDTHLIYDYDAQDEDGNPEKWRYELWCISSDRVVYAIHGGPMAGRINYQQATYQCIRPGELWQISWLEETGTVVSAVYDITNKKMTTLISFSEGHWKQAESAHGNKRNEDDLKRWRKLADVGSQVSRFMLSEQADVAETFKGKGDLEPITNDDPCF
jgi:phenolic acid decarboxylase